MEDSPERTLHSARFREVEKMKFVTAKPINTLRTIAYGLALAACVGGLASIASSAPAKAKDVKADVVYRNGFVYTVDSVRSHAQAFAVRDGKFLAFGPNDEMKKLTGPDKTEGRQKSEDFR